MNGAPGITFAGSATLEGGAPLFPHLTLEISAGKWTSILGQSGVGKTSVLRRCAGLETGVQFDGDLTASDGAPLDGRIAYMAQNDLLFPWLSVTENVMLGARLRGDAADVPQAAEMIARVGLSAHANKKPSALSGGQRQRVALARTLMEDRPVVLLDEPFSALDAKTRSEMQDLAAELLIGRTVLLVTHDPAEAARLSHAAFIMTGAGLEPVALPAAPPVRAHDDPETLACQGALLRRLREGA